MLIDRIYPISIFRVHVPRRRSSYPQAPDLTGFRVRINFGAP